MLESANMQIIDGRKIRDGILAQLKSRVAALEFAPVFCDVIAGDDPASLQYVRMKERTAEALGIRTVPGIFPATITTEELVAEIQKIATTPEMAGLIVQLPLPASIDSRAVLDAVPNNLDVDAVGSETAEAFYSGNPIFSFPAAQAVLAVLDSLNLDLSQKNITVVGQGMLVGKPVTHLLRSRGFSINIVDSDTKNPEAFFRSADILITGVGKGHFITGDMIKEGAVIIDAGTSESNGGVVGDVDSESVSAKAGFLSPVPGGVGPVTVAMLMQNVVISAERIKNPL